MPWPERAEAAANAVHPVRARDGRVAVPQRKERRCDHRGGADRAGRAAKPAHPGEAERDRICLAERGRSEEHTSELQSLMRISYAVFCLKTKTCQKLTQTAI